MANRIFADLLFQQARRRLGILAALLMAFSVMACAADTPTPTSTMTVTMPPPTATVPLSPIATVALTATPAAPPTATAPLPPAATVALAPTSAAPPATAPTVAPAVPDKLAEASEAVFGLLEELLADLGYRESATPEELRASERLKERFEEMGYAADIQPFTFQRLDWQYGENAVVIESPVQQIIPGLPLSTASGGETEPAPLTPVGLGRDEDLPGEGLAGRVAWIQPGEIPLDELQPLQDKVNRAATAGAAAAVVSGNFTGEEGYIPYWLPQSQIPALLVPKVFEEFFEGLLTEGEVTLSVKTDVMELESRNVIAELKGSGDSIVVVGAHYDIVPRTITGANDNGSGMALVLSLAEVLAAQPLPFTVRFVLFGAEELGLYGSRHYVASLSEPQLNRIKAMLNFDVVGSGPHLAVLGHQELTELTLELAANLGVDAQFAPLPPGASSDHAPFQSVDIPALLLYAPDISRIHTPEDRLEFVRPELLGGSFLVAEALLQSPEFAGFAR